MEIKQPFSINDAVCLHHNLDENHSTCFEEAASIAAPSAETITLDGYHCHDSDTCTATLAESFSCRSPKKTMEPSFKRDQSIIDSSDSPSKVEEFERLHKTIASQGNDGRIASQGIDGQVNVQIAVHENALADLNEDILLPMPLHMYSRRKKGKNDCLLRSEKHLYDVQSIIPDQKAGPRDEQKRYTCPPRAVQSNVVKGKPKEGSLRGRAKLPSCKDDEGLHQQKLVKSTSPEKKRGRDVAILDDDCKIGGLSALGINSSVSFGSSEYAAVRVGLQARIPTLIEKARFKDELKQKDGLQQYLECRGYWRVVCCHFVAKIFFGQTIS